MKKFKFFIVLLIVFSLVVIPVGSVFAADTTNAAVIANIAKMADRVDYTWCTTSYALTRARVITMLTNAYNTTYHLDDRDTALKVYYMTTTGGTNITSIMLSDQVEGTGSIVQSGVDYKFFSTPTASVWRIVYPATVYGVVVASATSGLNLNYANPVSLFTEVNLGSYTYNLTYIAPIAQITYPVDGSGYTEYSPISFEYANFPEISDFRIGIYYDTVCIDLINTADIELYMGTGHVDAELINWGIGGNVVKLWYVDSQTQVVTLYDTVNLDIDITLPVITDILGITEGLSYNAPPSFDVRKYEYPYPVNVYINGEIAYRIPAEVEMRNFAAFSYSSMYTLGGNTVEISNALTDVVLDSVSFEIAHGSVVGGVYTPDPNDFIYDYTQDPVSSIDTLPLRDTYADGVLGSVEYGFQMLMYYIRFPFNFVANIVTSAVDSLAEITENVSSVTGFFQQIFSFLPSEVTSAFIGLTMVTCIFFVIKFFRG